MAFLHFYDGVTRQHVADLSDDADDFDFTVGLNGSISGSVQVKETDYNRDFLKSLKENSHFVKFGLEKVYGGVLESPRVNKNIWTIPFCGGYQYLDKIELVPSHHAAVDSAAVNDNDKSWIKVFYADSPVGVLYEVLLNLIESISYRGYDPNIFYFDQLKSSLIGTTDITWGRSYRLNGLETPTVKTVIEDILNDDGMELFRIRVSSDLYEDFQFLFEVVNYSDAITLDESYDNIGDITRDNGSVLNRAFSIAKGTNLKDESVIEKVPFDYGAAYSTLLKEAPQERSNSIKRAAETAAINAASNYGNLKFTSFIDDFDPLDYLSISSDRMELVEGIITEKIVNGNKITYSVQIGDPQVFNGVLQKPSDAGRRIIFNQLNSTSNLASKSAGRLPNSTGWRS